MVEARSDCGGPGFLRALAGLACEMFTEVTRRARTALVELHEGSDRSPSYLGEHPHLSR